MSIPRSSWRSTLSNPTRKMIAVGWGLVIGILFLYFALPEIIEVADTPDTIIDLLLRHTALVFPFLLLTAEEGGVPLPVPGDVIIAYIGYRAFQGAVPYPVAFVGLLAAILAGASFLYYLSSRWGQTLVDKVGKFMHVRDEHLRSAEKRFQAHGPWFIIIGRHIPGFRIPITIFCGISQVRYPLFLVSTMISVTFWIVFWLILGGRLGAKTVHLLHGGHWYTILIPFAIVLGAILIVRTITRFRSVSVAH